MAIRWVLAAAVACALGCGRMEPKQAGTASNSGAAPTTNSASPSGSSDQDDPYARNRLREGESRTVGNVRVSGVTVSPKNDAFQVSVKIENTSQSSVFTANSYVSKMHDEQGNDLETPGMFSFDPTDTAGLKERARELQPGESKTISFDIKPKVKSAKGGQLWVNTNQGPEAAEAKWLLEFTFPQSP